MNPGLIAAILGAGSAFVSLLVMYVVFKRLTYMDNIMDIHHKCIKELQDIAVKDWMESLNTPATKNTPEVKSKTINTKYN